MTRKINVLLGSTGIPLIRGGLESGYVDTFRGLRSRLDDCELSLYTGGGLAEPDCYGVWNISRVCPWARWLGPLIRRPNPYVVEQLSSLPAICRLIHRLKIDVFMYSEPSLGMMLYRLRSRLGGRFRLLHSNVGPGNPPFVRTDHVHQIAPHYVDAAIRCGESRDFHTVVPYGIEPFAEDFSRRAAIRRAAREQLGIPLDVPVAIAVGWISTVHKRVDYIIKEFAALRADAPFLIILGRMDANSPVLLEMAKRLLVPGRYLIQSVPQREVAEYYRAADFFVHAAFTEAFGRVFVEALLYGLPVIVHDFAVMHYVLGDNATFLDLSRTGALAAAVRMQAVRKFDPDLAQRGAQHVRDHFSWEKVAPDYSALFRKVAALPFSTRMP